MKLLIKQRIFSWLDSYDVFEENGDVLYTVKGELAWGHCLKIYDAYGTELGMISEKIFSWLPRFEMYRGGDYVGCIKKEFTFFKPKFTVDFNGWRVDGDFFEWDYSVLDGANVVATVSKQIFNWSDTYVIDVKDQGDALCVLMLVLAIDVEKCSRESVD